MAGVVASEPATLNQVAAHVGRGAPAVSRAVDTLVRAGLVERQADPENRRRLALRLTDEGRQFLNRPPAADGSLEARLGKLASSELRALERGIEILERLPR
jgi:DNA-binding MarR family transcriptional regulator